MAFSPRKGRSGNRIGSLVAAAVSGRSHCLVWLEGRSNPWLLLCLKLIKGNEMKVQAGREYKNSLGTVWMVQKVLRNGKILARQKLSVVDIYFLPSQIQGWVEVFKAENSEGKHE